MNHQGLDFRDGLRAVLVLGVFAGVCSLANAQNFPGGGPGGGRSFSTPEESFRRIDTNGDGVIDRGEVQQVDGFRKQFLTQMGIDGSRPIGLREYTEKREQAMRTMDFQQFRRPDGGGGGSFPGGNTPGGGGFPGFGGPPGTGGGSPNIQPRSESERGDGRRPEESGREERRDDRDRSRDDRRESSGSNKSAKKTTKPKSRVTQDLPSDFREKDLNGDGQIGLYEWDRKAFAQFFSLDRNGDGLLTPDELVAATKKSASNDKSSSKSNATTPVAVIPTAVVTGDSKSSPSASAPPKTSESPVKSVSSPPGTDSSAAVKAFSFIDGNRDGKLTEDEWNRSRSRKRFEDAKIEPKFPIEQAQFVELYKKVEAQ